MKIPNYLRDFFLDSADNFSGSVPDGFIFKTTATAEEFVSDKDWGTIKKLEMNVDDRARFHGGFVVVVDVREILGYILTGSFLKSLSPDIKEEILAYSKHLNFKKSDLKKKPTQKKAKRKKIVPIKPQNLIKEDPADIFSGKVLEDKLFKLERSVSFASPSQNQKIVVGPGEIIFSLIPSPAPQDQGSTVRWWVIKEYLPKIFGKSENSMQIILGEYPS